MHTPRHIGDCSQKVSLKLTGQFWRFSANRYTHIYNHTDTDIQTDDPIFSEPNVHNIDYSVNKMTECKND